MLSLPPRNVQPGSADATAYIGYVYDAVVQFKWEGHAEGRAKENVGAISISANSVAAAVRPSTGTRPDVTLGASNQESVSRSGSGAGSGAYQEFLNTDESPANSISGSVSSVSSQMVHETSVPTVFFGIMSSILGDAAASTKELLVTADLILSVVLYAPMLFQKFIIESGEHPLVSLTTLSGGMTPIVAGMTGQSHGNPHVFCDGKLLQRICARMIVIMKERSRRASRY